MAYEVTATRRRPQRFEDLVGQEFVAQTFQNSISSKKIAHAYLFSGPRGCGKTSTARILAKALNCAEGPTASPCGHCQQCIEITKGSCTDVIEIDGASNTSVNDVRQIKDEVLFPPQSCRYKIYIIDEVHMLSTSAFNALLKTIEEPPPYVIFIFATTELQKVPATIKSRCQQFNFRLVPVEKVKALLAEAASEIGIKAEDEALYWIARESTGSIRDAYTLFDQVAAFSGDEITYDKIRDKLGLVGVDRLNAIFEDCAGNKTSEALNRLDEFLQSGISIEQLISNSTDYLRSLLLIKNGIKKESLLGQAAERFSTAVIDSWNPVQIERALSIFLQLYRDIRYSLNPRYELELAFSRLSWLSQYVSPAEVKSAIDKAKNLLEAGNISSAAGRQPVQQQEQRPRKDFSSSFSALQNSRPAQIQPQAQTQLQPQAEKPVTPAQEAHPYTGYAPDGEMPPDDAILSVSSISPSVSSVPPDSYNHTDQDFSAGGAEPPEQTDSSINNRQTLSSAAEIRDAVLKELAVTEPMTGTLLMQTGEWLINGDAISTTVESAYTQNKIQSLTEKIRQLIYNISGKKFSFTVTAKRHIVQDPMQNAPESVMTICRIFKGQVVAHLPPQQNQAEQNEQNTSPANTDTDADSNSAGEN